jgi:hypothetical protein
MGFGQFKKIKKKSWVDREKALNKNKSKILPAKLNG